MFKIIKVSLFVDISDCILNIAHGIWWKIKIDERLKIYLFYTMYLLYVSLRDQICLFRNVSWVGFCLWVARRCCILIATSTMEEPVLHSHHLKTYVYYTPLLAFCLIISQQSAWNIELVTLAGQPRIEWHCKLHTIKKKCL